MIELGKKARDKITGFVGIVTARVQYITGCDQYGLTPPADNKGDGTKQTEYFDEARLEVLKIGGVKIEDVTEPAPAKTGGPNRDMPRR